MSSSRAHKMTPASGATASRGRPTASASAAGSSANASAAAPRKRAPATASSSADAASAAPPSARVSARQPATASPASARPKRASSASSSSAAAATPSSPPAIPLFIADDPLSRTTTPVLHLIASFLAVSEVHCLGRASRLMYASTMAADSVWKPRWARAQAAGLGANVQAAPAPAAAPASRAHAAAAATTRRGAPAARGRAASATSTRGASSASSQNAAASSSSAAAAAAPQGASMSSAALAHHQADLSRHSHVPSSLPPSSVYRWALLSALRTDQSARFGKWALTRSRNTAHTLVYKPMAEALGLKVQLRLQLHQKPLRTPIARMTLFDMALATSWRAEPGVQLRDLRSVSAAGHSGKLMQSFPLGGQVPESSASSVTREWVCVRQAANDQSLSLLEWRVKGTGDVARRAAPAAHLEEHAADSPFAPNAFAQRRVAASLASANAASARANAGTLPISGLHLSVLAGVWGCWDGSSSSSRTELAFLWLSLPYTLLLAHLPVPSLPSPLRQPRWIVPSDDLDSRLGLHGLRVCVSFRNNTRSMWSWFFSEVTAQLVRDAPRPSGAAGTGAVHLNFPPLPQVAPKWSQLPSIPWRGENWSGSFEGMAILELVVAADERVLWVVSEPIAVEALAEGEAVAGALAGLSMDEPSVRHMAGIHRDVGVGMLRFELSHSPAVHASADGRRREVADALEGGTDGSGITRLQALRIELDLPFVDERFGTVYARAGAAHLSHALQSRAEAEMDPAAFAQFQRSQMGLRSNIDDERPLPAQQRRAARGGAAAAAHYAPNFEVHAPAAAASARGGSAAASSSSATRGGRGRARAQWQDTTEPRDDDAGFKF